MVADGAVETLEVFLEVVFIVFRWGNGEGIVDFGLSFLLDGTQVEGTAELGFGEFRHLRFGFVDIKNIIGLFVVLYFEIQVLDYFSSLVQFNREIHYLFAHY